MGDCFLAKKGFHIDEEENQLEANQYFIVLVIGSTRFWHHYAHCQELATIPLITTCAI
jgi:hypothetical protein